MTLCLNQSFVNDFQALADTFDRPELLLYWAPGALAGEALPGDARLLGRVTGTHAQRFTLPAKTGSLVLFALGHGAIVATARLEPAAPAAPAIHPVMP